MSSVNVPSPISFEGNVHQNWIRFFYDFEIYIGACGREKEDFVVTAIKDEEKKSFFNGLGKLLLNVGGDEAKTIAATFGLDDAKKFDYRELILKFVEYAKTEINDTYERFVFNSCVQQ
ncbi:hypothetical protein FOCC_FOCC015590 [Frankliniella occidentalis]|nr:hypothetical protein FOCC_FOCC015590 [Frankliniella occidentalis]